MGQGLSHVPCSLRRMVLDSLFEFVDCLFIPLTYQIILGLVKWYKSDIVKSQTQCLLKLLLSLFILFCSWKGPSSDYVVIRVIWIDTNGLFYVLKTFFMLLISICGEGCEIQGVWIIRTLFKHFLKVDEWLSIFLLLEQLSSNLNKFFDRKCVNIDTPTIGTSLFLAAGILRTLARTLSVADSVVMATSLTCRLESQVLIVIINSTNCCRLWVVAECFQCLRGALRHLWLCFGRLGEEINYNEGN